MGWKSTMDITRKDAIWNILRSVLLCSRETLDRISGVLEADHFSSYVSLRDLPAGIGHCTNQTLEEILELVNDDCQCIGAGYNFLIVERYEPHSEWKFQYRRGPEGS